MQMVGIPSGRISASKFFSYVLLSQLSLSIVVVNLPFCILVAGSKTVPRLSGRDCTMTPDLPGEYDDEARGSRPQDVGVSSLRPHTQCLAKGARRRRTMSRLSTSSPELTKQ